MEDKITKKDMAALEKRFNKKLKDLEEKIKRDAYFEQHGHYPGAGVTRIPKP